MRTLTRKLLSLLLVFTMVCAMVPAAMAADEGWSQWEGGNTSEYPNCQHTEADIKVTKDATCTTEGVETKTCKTCGCDMYQND